MTTLITISLSVFLGTAIFIAVLLPPGYTRTVSLTLMGLIGLIAPPLTFLIIHVAEKMQARQYTSKDKVSNREQAKKVQLSINQVGIALSRRVEQAFQDVKAAQTIASGDTISSDKLAANLAKAEQAVNLVEEGLEAFEGFVAELNGLAFKINDAKVSKRARQAQSLAKQSQDVMQELSRGVANVRAVLGSKKAAEAATALKAEPQEVLQEQAVPAPAEQAPVAPETVAAQEIKEEVSQPEPVAAQAKAEAEAEAEPVAEQPAEPVVKAEPQPQTQPEPVVSNTEKTQAPASRTEISMPYIPKEFSDVDMAFSAFVDIHRPVEELSRDLAEACDLQENQISEVKRLLMQKDAEIEGSIRRLQPQLRAHESYKAELEEKANDLRVDIENLTASIPVLGADISSKEHHQQTKASIVEAERTLRKVQTKLQLEESLNREIHDESGNETVNHYRDEEARLRQSLTELQNRLEELEEYEIKKESIEEMIADRRDALNANTAALQEVQAQVQRIHDDLRFLEGKRFDVSSIKEDLQAVITVQEASTVAAAQMMDDRAQDDINIDLTGLKNLYAQLKASMARVQSLTEKLSSYKIKEQSVIDQLATLYVVAFEDVEISSRSVEQDLVHLRTRCLEVEQMNEELRQGMDVLYNQLSALDEGSTSGSNLIDLNDRIADIQKEIKKVQFKSKLQDDLLIREKSPDFRKCELDNETNLRNQLRDLLKRRQQLEEYQIQKESIDEMINERKQVLRDNIEEFEQGKARIKPMEEKLQILNDRLERLNQMNYEFKDKTRTEGLMAVLDDDQMEAIHEDVTSAQDERHKQEDDVSPRNYRSHLGRFN